MANTEVAITNPFEQSRQLKQSPASTEIAVQRELAEVQASVLMARRFPRDPVQAMDRILQACTRPSLAQGALYTYARGGTEIEGPSIRLAETMAQSWGNLAFGVRELEQRPGESTMEAYCWDMETNVRQSRIFQVRHQRHTRGGSYALTDPRDIYEANANVGARRLRACILGIIPGDVKEAAVEQCEATLKTEADTSPEALKKLVEAFAQFGVTKEQIERRCQRRIDTIRPAQVVQLRKIWSSLRDEMSQPGDWFDMPQQPAEPPATGNEGLRQKLAPEPQTAFDEMARGVQPLAQEDEFSGITKRLVERAIEAIEGIEDPASTPGGPREEGTPIPPPPAGDAPRRVPRQASDKV